MYIRLNDVVYGHKDKKGIENNAQSEEVIRLKKPVIVKAEEFRIQVRSSWRDYMTYAYKTEITGDNYIQPSTACMRLLIPGDTVKLKKGGTKVRVNTSTRQSFTFYDADGSLKRRPYFYKNGELSFDTIDKENDENEEDKLSTDWMDDNLKYNYECFKNLIRTYYPNAVEDYIRKEFDLWYDAKKNLMDVFRKHPNWNEKEKCIVCDLQISRATDLRSVASAANELFSKMTSYNVFNIESARSYLRIQDLLASYCSYRYDECVMVLDRITDGIKSSLIRASMSDDGISTGMKASRLINAVMKKFNLTDVPNYNKEFAICSDAMAVKPLTVKYVVSLNICDFVTMSHGNSWSSCHSFRNHGGWHAGSLSYANDNVTVITYGLDKGFDKDVYYNQDKIFRQLFMINKDRTEYIQSRMYPASNTYKNNEINAGFNKILSEVGVTISQTPYLSQSSGQAASLPNHLNYEDYRCFSLQCNRYGSNQDLIQIGGAVFNFKDGSLLHNTGDLTLDNGYCERVVIIWNPNVDKSEYISENVAA